MIWQFHSDLTVYPAISVIICFFLSVVKFEDATEFIAYRRELPPPIYNPRRLAEWPLPNLDLSGGPNSRNGNDVGNGNANAGPLAGPSHQDATVALAIPNNLASNGAPGLSDEETSDPEEGNETNNVQVNAMENATARVTTYEITTYLDDVSSIQKALDCIPNGIPSGIPTEARSEVVVVETLVPPSATSEEAPIIKLEPVPIFQMARANSVDFDH